MRESAIERQLADESKKHGGLALKFLSSGFDELLDLTLQHIIMKGTPNGGVIRALERKDLRRAALIEAAKTRTGGMV